MLVAAAATAALLMGAANPAVEDARKKTKDGKYDEAIAGLEAELKKNPKNSEAKVAMGEAYTAQSESVMMNAQLPPFRKYPAALRGFRKAVEYDPNNRKAKENIATIEGIYKQMGREVPK